MKQFLLLTTIILLSHYGNGQNTQDHEDVKNVVNAFQKDYNNGFESAALYTTIDWEHINPEGGISKGRDSVLIDVRNVHQSFLKGVVMKIEKIEINFPLTDVAVANVIHKVSNYTTPDGVEHQNERQFKTYIVVKKNGKWLLFQDHATYILD